MQARVNVAVWFGSLTGPPCSRVESRTARVLPSSKKVLSVSCRRCSPIAVRPQYRHRPRATDLVCQPVDMLLVSLSERERERQREGDGVVVRNSRMCGAGAAAAAAAAAGGGGSNGKSCSVCLPWYTVWEGTVWACRDLAHSITRSLAHCLCSSCSSLLLFLLLLLCVKRTVLE